jgi:hypothetical protein
METAKAREPKEPFGNTTQHARIPELGATAVEALVDEWLIGKTNAYRDRYILKRRLIDGVPYCILTGMVEAEFGQPITERQLRRIVSAGLKILHKHGL